MWPNIYFDVNEDGRVTSLDALQILNRLAIIGGGEGEQFGSQFRGGLTPGRELSNITSQNPVDTGSGLQPNAQLTEIVEGEFCLPTKLAQVVPVAGNTPSIKADAGTMVGPESATRDNSMGPELWSERVDELLSDSDVSDHWF